MFHTFESCDKRTFDRAFRAGQLVAIGRETAGQHRPTFVGRGFTSATVADPYCDTGRVGRLRYWVAVEGSATPVGPVEWGNIGSPWRFYCETCERWHVYDYRVDAEAERAVHEHLDGAR